MTVYEAIAAVSADLAKTGIAKTRANQSQHYQFRGIDEVLNALAPLLAKHGLVIVPRMISRSVTEHVSKGGGVLFKVVVEAEFDFVSASHADRSMHIARTFGEAMDSADKATNKAMSAAYKYAAFLTFCIPLEGMAQDADAETPEVVAKAPAGYDDWLADLESLAGEGVDALKAAWDGSKIDYRKWLVETDRAKWDAMKKRAAQVSA